MLLLIMLNIAWNLHVIDRMCAKTTIRLWHDLYVEKQIAHDFADLLAPEKEALYIGVTRHDEVRAIASCRRKNVKTVEIHAIAHAPVQPEAAVALIHLMHESNLQPNWDAMKSQPRWFCEELFLLEGRLLKGGLLEGGLLEGLEGGVDGDAKN